MNQKILILQKSGFQCMQPKLGDTPIEVREVVAERGSVPAAVRYLETKSYTDPDFKLEEYSFALEDI